MRVLISLLVLGVVACGKGESAAEIKEVAKETLAAVRATEVVRVQVRLEKPEPPTPAQLETRKQIEERIQQENVGTIVQTSTDVGHYDFTVEVASTNDALPRVRAILRDAGVLEQSTVRVDGNQP
ncbi:MAG TPA: hypothetical protein VF787_19080 [Thermoanaerobaculia bacterium]